MISERLMAEPGEGLQWEPEFGGPAARRPGPWPLSPLSPSLYLKLVQLAASSFVCSREFPGRNEVLHFACKEN